MGKLSRYRKAIVAIAGAATEIIPLAFPQAAWTRARHRVPDRPRRLPHPERPAAGRDESQVMREPFGSQADHPHDEMTVNSAGDWVPAIPLPMYGFIKRQCRACDRWFWSTRWYRGHYAVTHILKLLEGP